MGEQKLITHQCKYAQYTGSDILFLCSTCMGTHPLCAKLHVTIYMYTPIYNHQEAYIYYMTLFDHARISYSQSSTCTLTLGLDQYYYVVYMYNKINRHSCMCCTILYTRK